MAATAMLEANLEGLESSVQRHINAASAALAPVDNLSVDGTIGMTTGKSAGKDMQLQYSEAKKTAFFGGIRHGPMAVSLAGNVAWL